MSITPTHTDPAEVSLTSSAPADPPPTCVALLGNPNTGKSTLFNRLTGLRQKTSNYPGTTIQAHMGTASIPVAPGCCDSRSCSIRLIDLPGVYSLQLGTAEAQACCQALDDSSHSPQSPTAPDAVCVVLDVTSLRQGLRFLGEVARHRLPTIVALTMADVAKRRGIEINATALEEKLGCPVCLINPRKGVGVGSLQNAFAQPRILRTTPPADEVGFRAWIDDLHEISAAANNRASAPDRMTDRLDWAFTHPIVGLFVFAGIMTALFWILFRIAVYPMNWIQWLFAVAGDGLTNILPPGLIRDLLVGGVVPGLAGVVVFLPQICLLFFLLSLLEDTGYLARASFVADRLLKRFGLPGAAFIPLLSSHACAIPGIIAARSIPNRRERLATILVAPFMSCSARLPVYALLVSLLFADRPSLAALAFFGCYVLGAGAGIFSALIARGTILKGASTPMTLELPSYKTPSVRTALLAAYDKGMIFLKKAGAFILTFAILLWWLSSFPHSAPPAQSFDLRAQASSLVEQDPGRAAALISDADHIEARSELSHSFAGRLGRFIEPVFAPLGFDWRVNIGVVTSFAAREVFVSTVAIVFTGDQDDAQNEGVIDASRSALRDDGVTPVFTRDASWALLVFYVLAMQCFSTLVVTARETGSAKWAVLQFVWMTGIAYIAALGARHLALAFGYS